MCKSWLFRKYIQIQTIYIINKPIIHVDLWIVNRKDTCIKYINYHTIIIPPFHLLKRTIEHYSHQSYNLSCGKRNPRIYYQIKCTKNPTIVQFNGYLHQQFATQFSIIYIKSPTNTTVMFNKCSCRFFSHNLSKWSLKIIILPPAYMRQ